MLDKLKVDNEQKLKDINDKLANPQPVYPPMMGVPPINLR